MKKKTPPRLILKRETIQQLSQSTLQGVAGGVRQETYSRSTVPDGCPPYYP
jgi:hypothetical protein